MTKLKNGAKEASPLVAVTMTSITHLWESGLPGVLTLSDFVQICRNDPKYRKFGRNEDDLKQLNLLRLDGSVHESIRNIVLSAFSGEGLNLELRSPIAK